MDPSKCTGRSRLPPNLYLQLDNSAKDNKNQFLMAFLSLLTAKGVFKEIQVGFLLVGHTHEDIDAYFSHLSKALKNTNTFVLADLMKAFMQSQELSFMPEFVQEIADFKSYIKGYQCDGATRLIGLGDMHLFKFYVDSDGWPVMRWKKSAVDTEWQPQNKPAIRLWKEDDNGRPLLPSGPLDPVPFKHMWGSEVPSTTGNQEKARESAAKATERRTFMMLGIRKYIEYWESGRRRCSTFAAAFEPYVQYWSRVLNELQKPLPPTPARLVEGFWPIHDWRGPSFTIPRLTLLPFDETPEDEEPQAYCGPANERPEERFNPWRQIAPLWWVLLRPENPVVCPVWLGRAVSPVCRDEGDDKYGKFLIQYWEPQNAARDMAKKYENCWSAKWVVEDRRPEWIDVAAVLYASYSRIANPKSRTIPKRDKARALDNLTRANIADP